MTFEDFETVLEKAQVRASVSVKSLTEFKEYADRVRDTKSVPEIERSIRELSGQTPIDMDEVTAYVTRMAQERKEWLDKVMQKCQIRG